MVFSWLASCWYLYIITWPVWLFPNTKSYLSTLLVVYWCFLSKCFRLIHQLFWLWFFCVYTRHIVKLLEQYCLMTQVLPTQLLPQKRLLLSGPVLVLGLACIYITRSKIHSPPVYFGFWCTYNHVYVRTCTWHIIRVDIEWVSG